MQYIEKRGDGNYKTIIFAERDGADLVIQASIKGSLKVEGVCVRIATKTIKLWAEELNAKRKKK